MTGLGLKAQLGCLSPFVREPLCGSWAIKSFCRVNHQVGAPLSLSLYLYLSLYLHDLPSSEYIISFLLIPKAPSPAFPDTLATTSCLLDG